MSSAELKERFSIELEPSIEDFVAQLEAEMKHIEINKQEAKRDCDMQLQFLDENRPGNYNSYYINLFFSSGQAHR